MKTTNERLEYLVGRIDKTSRALGILPPNLYSVLEHGNAHCGIAWKLVVHDKSSPGIERRHPALSRSFGHVGRTKREADSILTTIAETLDGVEDGLRAS